jgi:hypothetical protein
MEQEVKGVRAPFTVKEAARAWRICDDLVYARAAQPNPPFKIIRFGKRILIPAAEVERIAAGE